MKTYKDGISPELLQAIRNEESTELLLKVTKKFYNLKKGDLVMYYNLMNKKDRVIVQLIEKIVFFPKDRLEFYEKWFEEYYEKEIKKNRVAGLVKIKLIRKW